MPPLSPLHEASLAAKRNRPAEASKTWNNASLRKLITPEPVDPRAAAAEAAGPYEDPTFDVDAALAGAKNTLANMRYKEGRPWDIQAETSDPIVAAAEARERADAVQPRFPMLRALTDQTDAAAGRLGTASLAAVPVAAGTAWATGGTSSAVPATLGTAAGLASLPGIARKFLIPEHDESRGEAAVQGALTLPFFKSGRALVSQSWQGFKKGAQKVDDFVTGANPASRAADKYVHTRATVPPDAQLQRSARRSTEVPYRDTTPAEQDPLAALLNTDSFRKLRTPATPAPVHTAATANAEAARGAVPGGYAPGRVTGSWKVEPGQGGLADLLDMKPYPMPVDSVKPDIPRLQAMLKRLVASGEMPGPTPNNLHRAAPGPRGAVGQSLEQGDPANLSRSGAGEAWGRSINRGANEPDPANLIRGERDRFAFGGLDINDLDLDEIDELKKLLGM